MGNRAIIKTDANNIGLYLHWNGGRDSVEPFLAYCSMKGYRSPETDGYGWARLAQVVGNFFGGSLSVGIVETGEDSGEWCDNGAYVIENWQIVRREHYEGAEQNEYDFREMLLAIDEAQPLSEQIGEYIRAEEVKTRDLKPGDTVIFIDYNGQLVVEPVIGIGADRRVNGQDVAGVPYIGKYGSDTCPVADNVNNYIFAETSRRLTAEQLERRQPKRAKREKLPAPVAVYINEQLNGIEIKFQAKPDEATREALKTSGFRWHRKKCVWYAKNDPAHMEMAQKLAGALLA